MNNPNKIFIVEPGFTRTTETIAGDLIPYLKNPQKTVLYIGEVKIQRSVLQDALLQKMDKKSSLHFPTFTTIEDLFKRGQHKVIGNEERVILLMFLVEKYAKELKNLIPGSGHISIPYAQQLLRLFDNIRLYLRPLDLNYLRKECQNHLETYPGVYNRAMESIKLFEVYRDFLESNNFVDSAEILLKYEKDDIPGWWKYDLIVIDGLTHISPLHANVFEKLLKNHLKRGKTIIAAVYDVPEIDRLVPVKDIILKSLQTSGTQYLELKKKADLTPQTTVYSFTSVVDEISWIARKIKEIAILSGDNMPKILLTSPSVYRYLPYIEKVFREYGISIGRQFGPPITLHPFVHFILQAFDVVSGNYLRFDTVSLLSSLYFKMSERDKEEIDIASLQFPVFGTRKQWMDFINSTETDEGSLSLPQKQYLSKLFDFQKTIEEKERLPFNAYLSHIRSFIEEFSDTGLSESDSSVMEIVLSSFATLENLSETLGNPEVTLTGFRDILFSILRQKRLPEPEIPPPEHPVVFVGFEQVTHIPHDYLFVVGFDEDAYPHDLADWRIFPDRLRRSIGLPHQDQIFDIQEQRFNAVSKSPDSSCYISFVSLKGDRQVMPSIFIDPKAVESPPYSKWRLKKIFSLKEKHRLEGLSSGISFKDLSRKNLERLISLSIDVFSMKFDSLSVTDLEEYAECPMFFVYNRILKLDPVKEPEPVIERGKEGTWFHKLMEVTFRDVKKSEIHPISLAEYENYARIASDKLGIFPLWHKYLVNRYREPFEIVVNEFNSQLGKIATFEVEYWLELEIASGYKLKGKSDRIDVFDSGEFRVIDYKTSKLQNKLTKAFEYAKAGTFLQLPLYAHMFRLQRGLKPSTVMLFTWYKENKGPLRFELIYAPYKTKYTIEDVIDAAIEKSIEIIDNIRAKKFPPNPSNQRCERCRFKPICPEYLT